MRVGRGGGEGDRGVEGLGQKDEGGVGWGVGWCLGVCGWFALSRASWGLGVRSLGELWAEEGPVKYMQHVLSAPVGLQPVFGNA